MTMIKGGLREDYEVKTKWDALVKTIDEEIKKGNGNLIRGRGDFPVYGLNVLNYSIAFRRTPDGRIQEINPKQWLPMEIDALREDIKYKLIGFLD